MLIDIVLLLWYIMSLMIFTCIWYSECKSHDSFPGRLRHSNWSTGSPRNTWRSAGQVTREPVRTRAVDAVVQKTVSQTSEEEKVRIPQMSSDENNPSWLDYRGHCTIYSDRDCNKPDINSWRSTSFILFLRMNVQLMENVHGC